jgi:diguanylate cyclase (GGDEF)-like protein
VVYFDLDQFRCLNHAFGHNAGDRYLQEISAILRSASPESALLARVGGDEFMLLLPDTPLLEGWRIAESMANAVARHACVCENVTRSLTLSGGAVEISRRTESPTELFNQLEVACAYAKAERGCIYPVPNWPEDSPEFGEFLRAQERHGYDLQLAQLRQGRITPCRRWFIFPRLEEPLSDCTAPAAHRIKGLEQARDYLAHPVLGPRLLECAAVVEQQGLNLTSPDVDDDLDAPPRTEKHIWRSLTLFALAAGGESVFRRLLDQQFGGMPDAHTYTALGMAGDPKMHYRFTHDALTGLLGMQGIWIPLRAAYEAACTAGVPAAYAHFDIERFRDVHMCVGHVPSDEFLRKVAELIRDAVGEKGVVARVGGDEYAALFTDCSIEQARFWAKRVMDAVARHPFRHMDKTYPLTLTGGLAEVSRRAESFSSVCWVASAACRRAKGHSGSLWVAGPTEFGEDLY